MLLFSCKYAAGMLKTSDIGRFFRIIEKEMDKVKILYTGARRYSLRRS